MAVHLADVYHQQRQDQHREQPNVQEVEMRECQIARCIAADQNPLDGRADDGRRSQDFAFDLDLGHAFLIGRQRIAGHCPDDRQWNQQQAGDPDQFTRRTKCRRQHHSGHVDQEHQD